MGVCSCQLIKEGQDRGRVFISILLCFCGWVLSWAIRQANASAAPAPAAAATAVSSTTNSGTNPVAMLAEGQQGRGFLQKLKNILPRPPSPVQEDPFGEFS
jgi:hypothetical protein